MQNHYIHNVIVTNPTVQSSLQVHLYGLVKPIPISAIIQNATVISFKDQGAVLSQRRIICTLKKNIIYGILVYVITSTKQKIPSYEGHF